MKAFRNAYMTVVVSHINPNPSLNPLPLFNHHHTPHPFLSPLRNAPFRFFNNPHSSSSSFSEVLEKGNTQIGVIKEHFNRLAEILKECPGQYYRYHNDWRSETQTVVSLLTFMHWLETGVLLMHHEAQEKLGLNTPDFGLDIEDYLVGVCFMSNELPRYVVNRVTYGDYDSPRKVLNFLTELHAAFRMLNLRNDFLRKKFDGMKYDLKRVEEVYYDVKIRGLSDKADTTDDQGVQGEPQA
ncbi:hypothetical protein KSS87_021957 [Heliosperma pusillum]|nr:hypothetical protein KSS87_021957 [Heliosperma pusillum]